MKRPSPGLNLDKAIVGFLQYKVAEALSPNTIRSYQDDLKQFRGHAGDLDVSRITPQELRAFFAWLRTDYRPRRLAGGDHPLAPKTLRNKWVSLSAFFRWVSLEFGIPNPMESIPAPRFQVAPVEPFLKTDIENLLKASEFSREVRPGDRRRYIMRRATFRRDRALILTLLDTGLRASELCALKVGDLDPRTGRVEVKHGTHGGAKGGKGRAVFLGKAARRAVWRYLAEREDGDDADAPLFLGKFNRPLNKDALRHLIVSPGRKAEVKKCHPHRFRHTFAITYLRSGGDVFTLQALLGHSTLDMVRRYARIAEIDLQDAHRRASPADNWRL